MRTPTKWSEVPVAVVPEKARYTCACGAICCAELGYDYGKRSAALVKLDLAMVPTAVRVVKNTRSYGRRPCETFPLIARDVPWGQKQSEKIKCPACAEKLVAAAHDGRMVEVRAVEARLLAEAHARFPDETSVRREARVQSVRRFARIGVSGGSPPRELERIEPTEGSLTKAWRDEYEATRKACVEAIRAAFPEVEL